MPKHLNDLGAADDRVSELEVFRVLALNPRLAWTIDELVAELLGRRWTILSSAGKSSFVEALNNLVASGIASMVDDDGVPRYHWDITPGRIGDDPPAWPAFMLYGGDDVPERVKSGHVPPGVRTGDVMVARPDDGGEDE